MLVFGRNSVYEYLLLNKVKKLYLLNDFSDNKINDLISNINIKYVDRFQLDKMVDGNHQGIVAEVEDYQYALLDDLLNDKENSLIVLLDHIEDPHNLGAIIRTCEASGVDGVIIPKDRCALVNATVIKTSVGTVNNIKVSMVSNLTNTIDYLKKNGYWIVGTAMDGEVYTKINYSGKTVIVIGNEGKGMSDIIRKNCDFVASIPMYGTVNSLNASVAAGVMIYEVVRQTKGK